MKNTFSFLLALFAYTLISATLLLVSKGCVTTMEPTLWDFIKSVIMFAVVVYAVFTIITYLTNAMFVSAFKKTDYPKTLFWMLLPLHSVVAIVTVCLLFTAPIRYSGYHYTLAAILSVWCLYTHYNHILKHLNAAGIPKESAPQREKVIIPSTNTPTLSHTPNNEGQAILCKDVPDGRISFRSIDSQKRIPNIEDLLNRHARSLTGEHMKKLAQAASSAPKEHLPAYYSAAAYYYFYIEHNTYSAYLCCVSTLSLLSCMSKYDLILPEYQWIASEPELSSMLFDGDLGINQHYREFFSLDMISGRETGPLGAPILPSNHKYPH